MTGTFTRTERKLDTAGKIQQCLPYPCLHKANDLSVVSYTAAWLQGIKVDLAIFSKAKPGTDIAVHFHSTLVKAVRGEPTTKGDTSKHLESSLIYCNKHSGSCTIGCHDLLVTEYQSSKSLENEEIPIRLFHVKVNRKSQIFICKHCYSELTMAKLENNIHVF